jgi:hypothetical protein
MRSQFSKTLEILTKVLATNLNARRGSHPGCTLLDTQHLHLETYKRKNKHDYYIAGTFGDTERRSSLAT